MTALLCLLFAITDSASLTVRLNIEPAEHLEQTAELVDADLGAYRVHVAIRSTGEGATSERRSYLLLTDTEPSEAMAVTLVAGQASFAFAEDTIAFDLTGSTDEDVMALLELIRTDWYYATR
jgi:hypothetical protein